MKNRTVNAPPGTHARAVSIMMEFFKLPKVDLYADDAGEQLAEVCDKYLEICRQQDYRPSRESFAAALHIPLQQLSQIINGTKRGRPLPREVHEKLIEMDTGFQMLVADGMMNNEVNVIGSIFELKNQWGYKDQTEVVTVRKQESLTGEELKALADSLPDVIDGEYHEVAQIGDKSGEEIQGNNL